MKTENKKTLPELTPELLERARAGERDALTALYEATELEIYRTVHALLRDEDLSRDVQQDVYLHAFSRLDQLRDPAAFLPWLRQIAVNEARAQLRRKRPLLFSELTDEEETELPDLPDVRPEASPELTLERKENARLVREILDELPDGQRILLGMYYYEQMPVKQIAADTGLSEGTVKTQLHRGRKRVEEAVKRLEEQGVKLFGLAPLPFLLALLKRMTPAAEQNKIVMARALNKAGVVPITEAATVHVGRSFFETALGKVVLGLIAAAAVAGGAVGWRWYQSHVSYGDVRPTETMEINLYYESDEDLTTAPTADPTAEPVTTAPGTPEDLTRSPAETTEPVETTEPIETTDPAGADAHIGPASDPSDPAGADAHIGPASDPSDPVGADAHIGPASDPTDPTDPTNPAPSTDLRWQWEGTVDMDWRVSAGSSGYEKRTLFVNMSGSGKPSVYTDDPELLSITYLKEGADEYTDMNDISAAFGWLRTYRYYVKHEPYGISVREDEGREPAHSHHGRSRRCFRHPGAIHL